MYISQEKPAIKNLLPVNTFWVFIGRERLLYASIKHIIPTSNYLIELSKKETIFVFLSRT